MDNQNECGLGPWFCALYISLARGAKKQTDLRVHTYPILFERLMNGPKATSTGNDGWALVMMIGHFDYFKDALSFYTLWSKQTRGKLRRIQRGSDLFNTYYKTYELRLWTQPMKRNEAADAWKRAYESGVSEEKEKKIKRSTRPTLLLGGLHDIQVKRKERLKV